MRNVRCLSTYTLPAPTTPTEGTAYAPYRVLYLWVFITFTLMILDAYDERFAYQLSSDEDERELADIAELMSEYDLPFADAADLMY